MVESRMPVLVEWERRHWDGWIEHADRPEGNEHIGKFERHCRYKLGVTIQQKRDHEEMRGHQRDTKTFGHQRDVDHGVANLLLAFATIRSWRAVLCAVLPLVLTSILCEALMVALGTGVKVATLPVVAMGLRIGVKYAPLLFMEAVVVLTGSPLTSRWRPELSRTSSSRPTWASCWPSRSLATWWLLPALGHFLLRPSRVSVEGLQLTAAYGQDERRSGTVPQPALGLVRRRTGDRGS